VSDAAPAPKEAAAPVTPSDATVLYDCEGVEPANADACDEARKPGDDLVELSEQLPEIAVEHVPKLEAYWARAARALDAAERVSPSSFTTEERVLVQNAALHVALVSAGENASLSSRAKAFVKKLAFHDHPRAEPEGLEAWLGPSASWEERTTPMKPLFHETIFHDTRVLRIVRTKTLRANFAQLVAIDDAGVPFVTGVVAAIEMRRGWRPEAPACVVLASPARVRCKSHGGLQAQPNASRFPQSHFLAHDDDLLVRCNGCHTANDTAMGFTLQTLAPEETHAVLAARRDAALNALTIAWAKLP
jgi:hypothetical protein